jgi:hypothetical protein
VKVWERGRKEMKSISPKAKDEPTQKLDLIEQKMKEKEREVDAI